MVITSLIFSLLCYVNKLNPLLLVHVICGCKFQELSRKSIAERENQARGISHQISEAMDFSEILTQQSITNAPNEASPGP